MAPRRILRPLLAVAFVAALLPVALAVPETPKKPVVDRYLPGEEVTDPYRWLEDLDADAVQAWVDAQNRHADRAIDDLPALARLEKRVAALLDETPPGVYDVRSAGKVACAIVDGRLVVLASVNDPTPARVLVDPYKFLLHREVQIDFYALSGDGKHVAVVVSPDGLEDGSVHVFETATGKKLPDVIGQVSGPPGGDVAWDNDDAGFYYTHYPHATPGGKPTARRYLGQEVRHHRLGDPVERDAHVCGEELPRFPQLTVNPCWESDDLLIDADQGPDGSGRGFFLRSPTGGTRRVFAHDDGVIGASFLSKDELIVHSVKDAPRGRLMAVPLDPAERKKAKVLVEQADGILNAWTYTQDYLWVTYQKDGEDRVRILDLDGKPTPAVDRVKLPAGACLCADSFTPVGANEMLYRVEGYLTPPTWYRFDPKRARPPRQVALGGTWAVKFDDIEVVREVAKAADGTPIPMTILRPKGCPLDGKRPTLVHVYGGSKVRDEPYFQAARRVWFDHGGVVVFAHPRGSGELDEDAFKATLHGRKHVTGDDVIACVEHLVERKYTAPDKLAISGASFGGMVVGMAVTKRPDLFAAAIADGGVLDALRVRFEPFGPHLAFEHGRLDDRDEFRRVRAYSPYERVAARPDGKVPAVWLRAGANDRRVLPWHSWKMAARLQAAWPGKAVLVSTKAGAGHESWWPMEQDYAFLFAHLGVEYVEAK